jgi:hypothetical protein
MQEARLRCRAFCFCGWMRDAGLAGASGSTSAVRFQVDVLDGAAECVISSHRQVGIQAIFMSNVRAAVGPLSGRR